MVANPKIITCQKQLVVVKLHACAFIAQRVMNNAYYAERSCMHVRSSCRSTGLCWQYEKPVTDSATTDNFSPEYIAHLNSISHGSLLRTRKQSVMTKFRSCWAGKFGKVLLNRLNVSTTISYCAPPPCAHALRLPFAVSVIMWQK